MERNNRKRNFSVTAAILFLVACLCVDNAAAQPSYCPEDLYELAAHSRSLCMDESRGITTTTEAPPTTPEEEGDELFADENEPEEPPEPSPTDASPAPATSPAPRGSRRQRNKARRMSRRQRLQAFKDCFHREMLHHPMAADITDSCSEQVYHRNPTVESKREYKCFLQILSQECPGILQGFSGRRPNRFNYRRGPRPEELEPEI